jgi:hypothetical protein
VGRSSAIGKRRGGPWYGEGPTRLRFERNVAGKFPDLKAHTNIREPNKGRLYAVSLEVPHYASRRVEVWFPSDTPQRVIVSADGPTSSPHRYDEHQLCMWYPSDPIDQRWVLRDGLLCLLGMTTAHLFRESWWRETGEWLGPEATHADAKATADRIGS